MKTIAFYTLGCKVNQYETEAMSELFKKANYKVVSFDDVADIYLINTCSVTGLGERKSRQMIGRARKLNNEAIIIVSGCYAQTSAEKVLGIEGVNLVVGTKGRKNIVELAEGITKSSKVSVVSDIMDSHTFENLEISEYSERTRAYVKVQEGCNQFCSYCIIPYARGPIRSRDETEVLKEIQRLSEKGFKEVVLAGIHVASYGFDTGSSLAKLIEKVNNIDDIERIRLSSIEPMAIDNDFIKAIKEIDRLCHHFHISLQSGCDETLKRMNRKYTTDDFYAIVNALRKTFDDVSITTDIMVGFPGETEEEFNNSVEFVRRVNFADAHIFQYSPRKNTPAATMPNQISPEQKHSRSKIMLEIIEKSKNEFLQRFVGSEQVVLVEQLDKGGYYHGKTNNYLNVILKSELNIEHKLIKVKINDKKEGNLLGQIIE